MASNEVPIVSNYFRVFSNVEELMQDLKLSDIVSGLPSLNYIFKKHTKVLRVKRNVFYKCIHKKRTILTSPGFSSSTELNLND